MKKHFFFIIYLIITFELNANLNVHDSLCKELSFSKTAKDSMSLIKELVYIESNNSKKSQLIELLNKTAIHNKNKFYQNVYLLFKSKQSEENDDMVGALKFAYKALANSKVARNNNQIISSESQLGRIFYNFMIDDSAEYHFKNGIEYILINKLEDENAELSSLYLNLGLVYKYKLWSELSIEYFIKSYEIAKQSQDIDGINGALEEIGNAYIELKNYPKAEKYLLEALSNLVKLTINGNVLSLYRSLGLLYSHWGKYEKAEYYNKLALNGFKLSGENLYIWDEYNNLSIIYTDQKKYNQAIKYNNEAIRYSKKLNNTLYSNISNLNFARILVKTKQFDNAEQITSTIIKDTCCIERIDFINKGVLFKVLFELYQGKNDLKKALFYLVESKKIEDSINTYKINSKAQEIESKYDSDNKEKKILTLQNKNLKDSFAKLILGVTLASTTVALGIFGGFYRKILSQKEYIENLQQELHHRIKNNLSIINKFIGDIKSKADRDNIDLDLTDLQNKIESINSVHKQLYENQEIQDTNLKKYIDSLADNVTNSFNKKIELKNLVDDKCTIDLERIFPLGLIINEFMTNSFKHGFQTIANPIIRINTILVKNQIKQIEISDNGIGINQNNQSKNTLGIRMITLLSKQMDCELEILSNNGTKLILKFT